jgi:hypothetical protein
VRDGRRAFAVERWRFSAALFDSAVEPVRARLFPVGVDERVRYAVASPAYPFLLGVYVTFASLSDPPLLGSGITIGPGSLWFAGSAFSRFLSWRCERPELGMVMVMDQE